jgi:DNA-binding MarR family transcriptional regulator
LLRLTRKGATVYAGVKPTAQEIEAMLAAGLTKAEWNALQKALTKLVEHTQAIMVNGTDVEAEAS